MSDIKHTQTNIISAGMNKDLDSQALQEGMYVNAINARLNHLDGGVPFLSNEPANYLCQTIPYDVIGQTKLPSGEFAIFSTNDFNSEIGIFNETTCTYKRIVRSTCLGFNRKNLISATSKGNFDKSTSIYWTDGLNPRRVLNLDNIPYKYTILPDECGTKEYTDELNCDELLVDKKISYPVISVEFGTDGRLENGAYQVALAYVINGQVATDWMGVTSPIKHFEHHPVGKSLEVTIDNLDRDFDGYALAVIYTINGSTAVDKVGVYSTNETKVIISNVGPTATNNTLITLDEIVNKRPIYGTASDVVSTSQYLMWLNPTAKDELNYQEDAMNIKVKWVAYQLPKDYYRKGGKLVGYMRDEVYAFAIQWLYPTGDWSTAVHIGGRTGVPKELKRIAGQDVYENRSDVCDKEELPKYFEVHNTAKLTKKYTVTSGFCDPVLIAEGEMAYWESTETYPDNPIFGDDKCKPIRHHKFPDVNVISHHDGESPIILGARFENIKKPEGVVGYRIVRSDRAGNKSVVAKGLLFNTGNYEDNDKEWMYPNYPYNDLRNDPFLSTTQTKFNGRESDFNILGDFNRTKFTFHSPTTALNKPMLGTELKIESEEVATVEGKFEEVYRHPKYKMITNFAYGIAAAVGLGTAYLAVKGQKCVTSGVHPAGADGAPRPFYYSVECETPLMGKRGITGATIPLPNVAGIAIAFGYYFALGLQSVITTIKALSSWHQFAYQYNSHGFYNQSLKVNPGNKRRRINYGQYLIPGNQEINGVKMNNFNRESSVYLEINQFLQDPQTRDNSRNTISGFGLCDNPTRTVLSTASSYYGSIKRKIKNQYGQLTSVRYIDTGAVQKISDEEYLTSEDIFGGDTYVGRFTEKRKLTYFLNWPFDVPDGWEWDYRKYANIPYPRYWVDGTEFDFGDMARLETPSSKHNLDCYRRGNGVFIVKDRYFYLFNSGVIDYFAESEYCPDYRDWEDSIEGRHYDYHTYTELSDMFRSDKIQFDNRFIFDRGYLKQLTENFIPKQDVNYKPEEEGVITYNNRIIYSIAAQKEQIRDNWLIYPGLNYFDFSGEEGNLITAKNFDRDRIIFLFDRSAPRVTLGVNTLETNEGTKVLIGDGGVFAQQPQKINYTGYGFGSSETKNWTLTHFGGFYPSQEHGTIFRFDGNKLESISDKGMYWWFKEHLPSKLLRDYPNFNHRDNTLVGVGMTSVFDSTNGVVYFTKIDYKVKDEYKEVTTYNAEKDEWRVKKVKVDFKDPLFFDDCSFTISFDPKMDKWISFHDWHPESTIQTKKFFITVKDRGLWRHNELVDKYCNFYGKDYPFEVEFVCNNNQNTSTLSSLEYSLESYEYLNRNDRYHLRDFNFDHLVVYNSEQSSGNIIMERRPKTMLTPFPIFDSHSVRVEYTKVEQKYRVNSFWDLTKDRTKPIPLFRLSNNGYRKIINPVSVNYNKDSKKKFRHNYINIILRRNVCDNKYMKFKWINEKQIYSPR